MSDKVTLQAPAGVTDVSHGGENYKVVDGVVEVPQSACMHLYQFGLTNVAENVAKPPSYPEALTPPVPPLATPEGGAALKPKTK